MYLKIGISQILSYLLKNRNLLKIVFYIYPEKIFHTLDSRKNISHSLFVKWPYFSLL